MKTKLLFFTLLMSSLIFNSCDKKADFSFPPGRGIGGNCDDPVSNLDFVDIAFKGDDTNILALVPKGADFVQYSLDGITWKNGYTYTFNGTQYSNLNNIHPHATVTAYYRAAGLDCQANVRYSNTVKKTF